MGEHLRLLGGLHKCRALDDAGQLLLRVPQHVGEVVGPGRLRRHVVVAGRVRPRRGDHGKRRHHVAKAGKARGRQGGLGKKQSRSWAPPRARSPLDLGRQSQKACENVGQE